MGRKALLLVLLIAMGIGNAQSKQEQAVDESLKTVIYDIVKLAADKNIAEIDRKYVHPEFGIYDVFRVGVPDTFEQHSSISFAFPQSEYSTVYPNLKEVPVEYATPGIMVYNAQYDCNEMVWDREGLFVTDSISYPKISEVVKQPVFETSEFPKSLYSQAIHIEENSYRVVLTEFEIIFYLTKIDEVWYLTLFDRVTTDCSA